MTMLITKRASPLKISLFFQGIACSFGFYGPRSVFLYS
jgi:hypothetical protein